MSRTKVSPGILAILAAFRDSEDCDGDPTRPMEWNPKFTTRNGTLAKMNDSGLIRETWHNSGCTLRLTDSGLALFRDAFPDHPYTLDHAASEREATSRREYLANIVLHRIPDTGKLNVAQIVARFVDEYYEGHARRVGGIENGYDESFRESYGRFTLAEDDDYRASTFRFRFDRHSGSWEFRANLD